jgi:hypothetical protein
MKHWHAGCTPYSVTNTGRLTWQAEMLDRKERGPMIPKFLPSYPGAKLRIARRANRELAARRVRLTRCTSTRLRARKTPTATSRRNPPRLVSLKLETLTRFPVATPGVFFQLL